jgi:hypothetical protein
MKVLKFFAFFSAPFLKTLTFFQMSRLLSIIQQYPLRAIQINISCLRIVNLYLTWKSHTSDRQAEIAYFQSFITIFCATPHFPHTCITSQDTNAVWFTVNSKDTVFPSLCYDNNSANGIGLYHVTAVSQDNFGFPFTDVTASISAKLPEMKK